MVRPISVTLYSQSILELILRWDDDIKVNVKKLGFDDWKWMQHYDSSNAWEVRVSVGTPAALTGLSCFFSLPPRKCRCKLHRLGNDGFLRNPSQSYASLQTASQSKRRETKCVSPTDCLLIAVSRLAAILVAFWSGVSVSSTLGDAPHRPPMLPARQAEAVTRLPHQPPGRSVWRGDQETLGGSRITIAPEYDC
jgi:hypothetical protein